MRKILLFIIFIATMHATAQVTGRVVDEEGKALPFVNVVLLSPADSSAVGGTVTREDGTFILKAGAGRHLLRFAAVGYTTLYRHADGAAAQMAAVKMAPAAHELAEATVTYKRPVSKITGDGLATTVENTTLAKAGTATDVLERTPGIVKKAEGLEVMGRGTPVYYINGRQVRNTAELDLLRSEDIKSVEVINNPGARYDASVAAVVRIRTVKRKGEGVSIDAKAHYEQGDNAAGNGELNLNYRRGALDAFVNVDGADNKWTWKSNMGGTTVADEVWTQNSWQRSITREKKYGVTAGFNYDLSENNSVGLRYTLDDEFHSRSTGSFDSEVLRDEVFYDSLYSAIAMRGDIDPEHRLNAYYISRIGRGELSLNADFLASGSSNEQTTTENSSNEDDRVVHSVNNVRNRLWAAKAEYALDALGGKVTAGAHYTGTNRHDNYLIPDNDFNLSTAFSQLREQNVAGFAEYARIVGRMQVKAGLRYEHVTFDYFDRGERKPEQSRRFSNLFPSLSVAGMLGKVQFMTAYTAKTARPNYSQLSNNLTYANRYLMQSGNPYLRPTVKHNVEVMGVWKFLQATVGYTHAKDDILFWGAADKKDPKVTHVTFVNKSYDGYQATLTASPVFGPWHPTLTAAVVGSLLEMETFSGVKTFRRPLVVINMNNDVSLPAGLLLNLSASYQGKGNYQNVSLVSATFYASASLRKSFFNDRLTLTAGIRDIFQESSSLVRINFERGDFLQGGSGDSRRAYLTLRYKFNATRARFRGKSAIENELKRL